MVTNPRERRLRGARVTVRHWATWGVVLVCLGQASTSPAGSYEAWRHSAALWILTTPDAANLPGTCAEADFPLLVRLNADTFDFSQSRPDGADIRFSDAAGKPLAHQVEAWDAAGGAACIWVRIPEIKGNARQAITMHWGNADAPSESDGAAVFAADNGFCSVLHMDDRLRDETGLVKPVDLGSETAVGMIGAGRRLAAGTGIDCGAAITGFPSGDAPFSSQAWFRADACGAWIFGWGRYAKRLNGNTGDGNEVVISIDAPPGLRWASDGPGGTSSDAVPTLGSWCHVVATYRDGTSRIYVDGRAAGSRYHKAAMSLMDNVAMTIGGGRPRSFGFAGCIDEVRVSRVARSEDWIRLEYENQKAGQMLVGGPVQPGTAFSPSQQRLALPEGGAATVTAEAGGAQKVWWTIEREGAETVADVDRRSFTFSAGRVTADAAATLRFKALYVDGIRTLDIPVTIAEAIPEPAVTLRAPPSWNGRDPLEIVAAADNLDALRTKGADALNVSWTVSGGAVTTKVAADRLILERSQYSGPIRVQALVDNGGAATVAETVITVDEPDRDPWVERTPGKDEHPEDNQFVARNDADRGLLHCTGTLDEATRREVDTVFFDVFADDKPFKSQARGLAADGSYAFTVALAPGLVRYRTEFGTRSAAGRTVLRTAKNIVCGDAWIIEGQSNAEATGPNNGPDEDPSQPADDWIRSYGNQLDGSPRGGWGTAVRTHIWGRPNYGCHQIGAWGMVLARHLVDRHRMPVCFINAAHGGTPIWQHQRNPADRFDTSGDFYRNPYKIYGGLLTRVTAARLTHGIRGVIWHQGENDSGAGSPTNDWNYKTYQRYFLDMAAAWKQDFPNLRHYYVFQVWPLPCSMGPKDDQIREAQRTLPRLFSNLRVMSTVGVSSEHTGRGACHFDLDGYAQMGRLMVPLVEQDAYGLVPAQPVTAPNVRRAWYTTSARDEIALDFGQPVSWNPESVRNFHLDDAPAAIRSAVVQGDILTLALAAPSQAATITYLRGRDWDGKPVNLLRGANGIAALTFCDVPLAAPAPPAATTPDVLHSPGPRTETRR